MIARWLASKALTGAVVVIGGVVVSCSTSTDGVAVVNKSDQQAVASSSGSASSSSVAASPTRAAVPEGCGVFIGKAPLMIFTWAGFNEAHKGGWQWSDPGLQDAIGEVRDVMRDGGQAILAAVPAGASSGVDAPLIDFADAGLGVASAIDQRVNGHDLRTAINQLYRTFQAAKALCSPE